MKTISKKNFSALLAILLGIVVLTSAKSTESVALTGPEPVVEDISFIDDVEEYVDAYLEDLIEEEPLYADYVKIYDSNDELLIEGERSSLSGKDLQKLNQADLLTEERGTAYYQLNN